MFADGSNGSVRLSGDSIIIRRKGLANKLTQGFQGDKQVPLSSITATQFRAAGSMMVGVIQFTILGGREFGGGMLEATKDENAVMFTRDQEPAFVALRQAIQRRISEGSKPVTPASGAADELERLAALLEKGHLSTEEFAEAKRRVLSNETAPVPIYAPNPVVTGHPIRGKTEVETSAPIRTTKSPAGSIKIVVWIVGILLVMILASSLGRSLAP